MVLLLAAIAIGQDDVAEERKISNHALLKRAKLSSDERMKVDLNIMGDEEINKAERDKALQKYGALFVQSLDLGLDCMSHKRIPHFFYSKRIGQNIIISSKYNCQSLQLGVYIAYYIFMDEDKAKMGANEILTGNSESFYEDEVGTSFTGKKYGEFCAHGGNPERGTLNMFILYGKYLIDIEISGRGGHLAPELLDTWADAVMKKVKAFQGDVTAP
jgi:hypothetical protein